MEATVTGRAREMAILTGVVDDAARGAGGVLLVRGEPGIGKSHLLAAAAGHARSRGVLVLATVGVPAESHLPFAGLHQLLRPLLSRTSELPEPQRAAMLAAFGMSPGSQNVFFIALAALELLADAGPVVVLADDLHWLDDATVEVLAFLARRIAAEPIAVLAATRSGSSLDGRLVEVTGLDDDASRALLRRHAADLTPATRERLLTEAAGNPLALVELPAAIRAGRWDDAAVLPSMLPLTARLESAFSARLDDLPAATNALLLAAALDDGRGLPSEILAAAGVTEDALTAAQVAGLISLDGGRIRFRHPLIRAAVHHRAGDADRRRAHLAWSAVLAEQADRHLWHRAAAATGPDAAIADALEEVAGRERDRGALAAANIVQQRAARLTAVPADRARRLLDSAELAFELGHHHLVRSLVDEAGPIADTPREQSRVMLLTGVLDDGRAGDVAAIRGITEQARRMAAAGEQDLAGLLLVGAGRRCWWTEPGPAQRRAIAALADELPVPEPVRLSVLTFAEPIEQGGRVIAALPEVFAATRDPGELALLVLAAYITGDFDRCLEVAGPATDGLRAQGRLALLGQVLTLEASAAMHRGVWADAATMADEAVRATVETGQPDWILAARHVDAAMAGLRGDTGRAGEQVALIVGDDQTSAVASSAHQSRGLAALASGAYAEAYDQFRPAFDPEHPAYQRALQCWLISYLAEAAMHSGDRLEDARLVLAGLEELAVVSPSPALHVSVRYARAALAPDDDAEKLFRDAIDRHPARWPFPRARLDLAYGSWLRRHRRIAESREPLRAAREAFDRLGAQGWSERARQELRATGESSSRPAPDGWQRLSPQELQIATMAAAGMSNREIGQRLYLSHRTVGSHLYRLFPKLGITSRIQLKDAIAHR
ncbi:helix-turn-helix transcriptional regulator [Actinoplanes rectilineatus]|uniref:helix-turn-helix transcriptional regulator n=1 Tax=Actinoplanes rectilineatus TaxID=113571 RepID=UPI0009FA34E6|nr:LuxR family transcriptional regulator [Actinoplanes rectilineatus]